MINHPCRAPFFPRALPDETLHSRVSRFHALSGNHRDADTTNQLFGSRHAVVASPLPTRLAMLARATGMGRREVRALRDEGTLLPYVRPFLSEKSGKRLAIAMLGADGGRITMATGQPRSGVRWPSALQFCPRCAEQDRAAYGVAYWHRCHQAPGVLVCHAHPDTWLLPHEAPASSGLRHALYLPGLRAGEDHTVDPADPPRALAMLAELTHGLVSANLPPLGGERLRRAYRAAPRDQDLMTPSGRLRQGRLHEAFHDCYASLNAYRAFRGLAIQRRSDADWLAALFRGSETQAHPVKHLLVIGWLFGSIPAFVERLQEANPDTRSIVIPGEAHVCRGNDAMLARVLTKESASVSEAARRLGLSITTVQARASAMGITTERRPKAITPETCRRVRASLLRGRSVHQAACECGVSASSAYRILHGDPALKARLDAREANRRRARNRGRVDRFLRSHPDATVSDFRGAKPALYTWFYRHDHEWLRGRFRVGQPVRSQGPRCDWESRDRVLAEQIQVEAQRQYAADGKPQRISPAVLLRRTGATATFEKYKHHLPRARAALNAWSETVEDAQIRRIGWAIQELHLCGKPVAEWRLRRLAGLRPQCAPRVEAALREATGTTGTRGPDSGLRPDTRGQAGRWATRPGGIPAAGRYTPHDHANH